MTIADTNEVRAVLAPAQWETIRSEADRVRAMEEFAPDVARRREVGRRFQKLIDELGIVQGRTLTRDGLVEMVRLQWKVQNLNPMPLVRLLGTYPYYRHFKGFTGDEAAFEAHMRARRPGWREGSTGHPGADLETLSRDLRALLASEGHAVEFQRFSEHPGIGRGFTSGVLHLQRPARFGLLNGASIGLFRADGPFALSKAQFDVLSGEVRRRQGLRKGEVKPHFQRTLGLMLLFEEMRQVCGFDDFHELDFFHWSLAKETAKVEDEGAQGGVIRRDNVADLYDRLEEYSATIEPERIRVRKEAEDQARRLLAERAGRMTEEELRELFRLINVDHQAGKALRSRFAPAFLGKSVKEALAVRDATNRWIGALWNAAPENVEQVLDDFWSAGEIPGAGRSLPTGILYLKDPERYAVQINAMSRGLASTFDGSPSWLRGRRGKTYLEYNRLAQELRESLGLPPQAMDLVLWKARQVVDQRSEEGEVDGDRSDFRGFTRESFAFFEELTNDNTREWFDANRGRFRRHLKEPLRALVEELGRLFCEPYAPGLERAAKSPQTMSRMRKNVFGREGSNQYWPHYWAALHRKERKKVDDLQLFVSLTAQGLDYGLSTVSAREEDKELMRTNAARCRALVDPILAQIDADGFRGRFDGDQAELRVRDVDGLLEALDRDQGLNLPVHHEPDSQAVTRPKLADEIATAFRSVYPIFLLATTNEFERELRAFEDLLSGGGDDDDDAELSEEWLLRETLLDEKLVAEVRELLEQKRQAVFYGPPGTGKTWLAERFARHFAGSEERVWLVQFHPSYGYEDFVEGFRPVVEGGQVVYRPVKGIFRQICDEAQRKPKQRFVLVIDEINRGNLPRIFGELLYLLERRGKSVVLPISQDDFSVPPNVYLIGTMNTADQSIALLDAALRRRFHFFRFDPSPELLEAWLAEHARGMTPVASLLQRLNDDLSEAGIDRDRLIGHSHFMVRALDEERLTRIWAHSILPTIEEFFYGIEGRVQEFDLEAVQKRAEAMPTAEPIDLSDDDDGDAD